MHFHPTHTLARMLMLMFQVLAFDHNLKLLWEVDVAEKFPHHSHIKEVSTASVEPVCGNGHPDGW